MSEGSRPSTGRSARDIQRERMMAKKKMGPSSMVTASAGGAARRSRTASAGSKRTVSLTSPDELLKPAGLGDGDSPAAAASAASGNEDGVEEVQLVDSFKSLMAKEGLDDEHTPEELRFQVVAPTGGKVAGPGAAQRTGAYDFEDPHEFAMRPAPDGQRMLCRIIRDKTSTEKSGFPTYYLKLEKPGYNGTEMVDLLVARKIKKAKSSYYLVCTNVEDLNSEGGNRFVAKLRANVLGTKFSVFDNGVSPSKRDLPENEGMPLREELACVLYETNLLGFKGPRKMTAILPRVERDGRKSIVPETDDDGIAKRYKDGKLDDMLVLFNKKPQWNSEGGNYVLDFRGRVTVASVKNFQLVHESDQNYIVLQFGRIGDHAFTMDFQAPMCPAQAFAIALSSFDGKLAVE